MKKTRKMKMLILMVLLIISVVIAVIVSFFFFKKKNGNSQDSLEAIDADKYYKKNSTVLEKIKLSVNNEHVLTEAAAYKLLIDKGFVNHDIYTMYENDGTYHSAELIDETADICHPIYETIYCTPDEQYWLISIMGDEIVAYPASYNEEHIDRTEVILSESESIFSYDNVTNTLYKNIPKKDILIVKTVVEINADVLNTISEKEMEES